MMDFASDNLIKPTLALTAVMQPTDREVHFWVGSLSRYFLRLDGWGSTLSTDESDRANRFKIAVARERFCVGRVMLRQLLGRYLECAPREVRFRYNAHGKPSIDAHSPIHFNVAHSEDVILIAVARDMRLGIDIERIEGVAEVLSLADSICGEEEIAALRELHGDARRRAFIQIWTRKEAVLKAVGDGFSKAAVDLNVISGATERPELENDFSVNWGGAQWHVRDLKMQEGYASAIAVEQPGCTIHTGSIDDVIE